MAKKHRGTNIELVKRKVKHGTLLLSQHNSTSSVGQSGPFKYACLVIEARPIDWSGSQGSRDLLYGDSIALIGVCRSKMLKSTEF